MTAQHNIVDIAMNWVKAVARIELATPAMSTQWLDAKLAFLGLFSARFAETIAEQTPNFANSYRKFTACAGWPA